MTCHPHGEHEDDAETEFLSVYLELMSKAVRARAIFDIFLMSREGVPSSLFMKRCVRMYPPGCHSTLWGFRRFVDWKDLEDYCFVKDDGRVTLMWAVVVVNPAPTIPVPPSDMGTHLGSLLLDGAVGTDVSFVVDRGETFRAQRVLLAARSPVFKAELFGLMMEAKASSVVVHDIDPETFKAMLVFMYTDNLTAGDVGTTEMFRSLLVAADRYALDRLKLLCAQKLLDNVSMDILTTMIDFAETYNCPELKNKCVEFAMAEGKFNKFGQSMMNAAAQKHIGCLGYLLAFSLLLSSC
ncbi:BTB/POZ and MATH domain-containing protein 1-like [Aegilops tauschii subsp. strangulata]|uniref:Speckle-type POZ protein-like protein n=1 Tax=Aegilops tauschii TaxID=37682 RepID=M8BB63_AEGTA|nr:BTB/POZ and MATH domain-containing protein 1-like [Aegilops tauschii subsp. strangulata]